jgi:hypothetical protein
MERCLTVIAMDWKTLATFAPLILTSSVISGVLTVIGNHVSAVRREAKTVREKGDLSALLVAITLDQYAARCATTASETDTHEASHGGAGALYSNVPKAPTYPDEVDWQAIGIDMTTSVLDFGLRIGEAHEGLAGLGDVAPEQAIDDTPPTAIQLGLEALTLSETIRQKRGIEIRKPWREDWNTKTYLKERWESIEADRAETEAYKKAHPDTDLLDDPE